MKIIINLLASFLVVFVSGAIIFVINCFLAQCSYGDEIFMSYGLGVFKSAENTISETKVVNLGYRKTLLSPWNLELKTGGWFDGSNNPLRHSSLYASAGPQYVITNGAFVLRNGIGFGFITSPDMYLGGYFQFNPQLYLGYCDKDRACIGLNFNHFSSGGLSQPNIGRDSLSIELGQHF